MSEILGRTESVCPECLERIPAERVAEGEQVYLRKTCPQHGTFQTIVWRGAPALGSWVRPKTPAYPRNPATAVERGCPFDCGLCPDHRQHTCTALLEVTQRCDLRCPVCFANAGGPAERDPQLTVIETWYQSLLQAGAVQRPVVGRRAVRARRSTGDRGAGPLLGFRFIQVNTNGLHDILLPGTAQKGGSSCFLQFDGPTTRSISPVRPAFWSRNGGRRGLLQVGIGVILVPTPVPG